MEPNWQYFLWVHYILWMKNENFSFGWQLPWPPTYWENSAIISDQGGLYTFGEADGGKLGLGDATKDADVPTAVALIEDKVIMLRNKTCVNKSIDVIIALLLFTWMTRKVGKHWTCNCKASARCFKRIRLLCNSSLSGSGLTALNDIREPAHLWELETT